MTLDIAIESIIPDNTAFTVLTALANLGYMELTQVERAEHVFLDLDETVVPEIVAQQISRAEILCNPNKHRLSYARMDAQSPNEGGEFEALVRDKDEDNKRLAHALASTFGIRGLRGLERAVGWRLREHNASASRERLEWACQALLANPVSQRYWIRQRPNYSGVSAGVRS